MQNISRVRSTFWVVHHHLTMITKSSWWPITPAVWEQQTFMPSLSMHPAWPSSFWRCTYLVTVVGNNNNYLIGRVFNIYRCCRHAFIYKARSYYSVNGAIIAHLRKHYRFTVSHQPLSKTQILIKISSTLESCTLSHENHCSLIYNSTSMITKDWQYNMPALWNQIIKSGLSCEGEWDVHITLCFLLYCYC